MSRLPLNLRSFGIAGLGSAFTDAVMKADLSVNIGSKMFPIYVKADATQAERMAAIAAARKDKTPTNTITPYNISPSIKPSTPATTVGNTIGFKPPGVPAQASVPMQSVQAQVSTPGTADPIRWIPIALGGVGVLGLLYILMRRR